MATGAAQGLIRCVLDVCLSLFDVDIERRPYHRNCTCALHKSKATRCYKVSGRNNKNISYPMRRSYSESCLMLADTNFTVSPSPSSPVNILQCGEKTKLQFCKEEECGSYIT
ncbi:hypothetical protein AQUCO_01600119v1 [Aquilegia coerulea]|uniref:Uncharacterized protein n=1 Tax=Aquilegia coerulea TaxID=218851 RepID=A0A2G5DQ84_AQUCA|nr:hypothetical protein AQUCO_01600119v1 [Aquilegia coerulea]